MLFSECNATNAGGGLYAAHFGNNVHTNAVTFDGCSAIFGAAWYTSGGTHHLHTDIYVVNSAAGRAIQAAGGNVTITRLVCAGNQYGCIAKSGDTLWVVASTFYLNSAPNIQSGGAISTSAHLIATGSYFYYNNAYTGGAVATSGTNTELASCYFEGNACTATGLFLGGGGGAASLGSATSTVYNCTFVNNDSPYAGGALFSPGYLDRAVSIIDSTFRGNHANQGGGAWITTVAFVSGTFFEENVAVEQGGGVFLNGELHLERVNFVRNTAEKGGGLSVEGGTINVTNCEFRGNSATTPFPNPRALPSGGGVLLGIVGGPHYMDGTLFVGNSATSGGAISASSALLVVTDCAAHTNVATQGGAIHLAFPAVLHLENFECLDNRAVLEGGCLYAVAAVYAIYSSVLAGNEAAVGAAIACVDSTAVAMDGAVLGDNIPTAVDGLAVSCTRCTGCYSCDCTHGLCDTAADGTCLFCSPGYGATEGCDTYDGKIRSVAVGLPSEIIAGATVQFSIMKRAMNGLDEDVTVDDVVAVEGLRDAPGYAASITPGLRSGNELTVSVVVYKAGMYTMTITLNGFELNNLPSNITVVPAVAAGSKMEIPGPFTVPAGANSFVIFTKDVYGNACPANVRVFDGTDDLLAVADVVEVGRYSVSVVREEKGELDLDVYLNDVFALRQLVEIVPTSTFASACLAWGAGLTLATLGEDATFYIQARDRYRNNRTTGGDVFEVSVTAADGVDFPPVIVDGGDGVYSVSFVPAYSSVFTIVIKIGLIQLEQSEAGLVCVVRGRCPPGQSLPPSGVGSCVICDLGTFASESNQDVCTACPATTTTATVGATALDNCTCRTGLFSENGLGGEQCSTCPSGAACEGGLMSPYPKPGFWRVPEVGTMIACLPEEACLGGQDNSCREGYSGFGCSVCSPSYFKRNYRCVKCSPGSASVVAVCLVAFFILCLLWLAYSQWAVTRSLHTLREGNSETDLSLIKLLVTYLQLIALIAELPLGWPGSSADFFLVVSVLNFNTEILSPECSLGQNFSSRYLLVILLPLVALFTVAGAIAVLQLVHRVGKGKLSDKMLRRLSTVASIKMLLSFSGVLYINVSKMTLSIFDCSVEADGLSRLAASRDVLCGSSKWLAMLPFALLSLIFFVVGVPILIAARLLVLKRSGSISDELTAMYGGVFMSYADRLYQWELVFFTRKLVFVIFQVFLTARVAEQSSLLMGVLFLNITLVVNMKPFKSHVHNRVAVFLDMSVWFTLFAGVIFYSEKAGNSTANVLAGFVVFVVCVSVVLTALIFILEATGRLPGGAAAATAKGGTEMTAVDSSGPPPPPPPPSESFPPPPPSNSSPAPVTSPHADDSPVPPAAGTTV